MKKARTIVTRKLSGGNRIIASLKQAVEWAEGKGVPVRMTQVEVPTVDVRAVRQHLGLSQAAFAAKYGFQPATLRNWEQGRTRPDGPARVLLAVIARNPKAVEDALRKASQNENAAGYVGPAAGLSMLSMLCDARHPHSRV